jgi:hypothetical protein
MYRPLIDAVITADEISVDQFGTDYSITIPFAQSDDGETTVSLECNARLESFEDESFYEFSFHITVIPDPENPEEIIEIWTPEVPGQYIRQKPDRCYYEL